MFWNAMDSERKLSINELKEIWNKVHLNIFKNMFIFLDFLYLNFNINEEKYDPMWLSGLFNLLCVYADKTEK